MTKQNRTTVQDIKNKSEWNIEKKLHKKYDITHKEESKQRAV